MFYLIVITLASSFFQPKNFGINGAKSRSYTDQTPIDPLLVKWQKLKESVNIRIMDDIQKDWHTLILLSFFLIYLIRPYPKNS